MKARFRLLAIFLALVGAIVVISTNPVLWVSSQPGGGGAQPDRLRHDVEELVGLEPARTFLHPESLQKASEMILKKFESAGLTARFQDFLVEGKSFRNVIAQLGPDQGERLVIGAHYDAFNGLPGADDNASGVAGLLEIARLLKPVESKLRLPIELVAYTLEEPPQFASRDMGSHVHVQSLQKAGVSVRLMISLEMIGYFSDEPGSQEYPMRFFSLLYPSTGNYISMIARPQDWWALREAKRLFLAATDLPLQTANVPTFVPGVDFSDHAWYWAYGYPALMITDTAFMRNHAYHTKDDVPERLDYRRMAQVVDGVVAIALGL